MQSVALQQTDAINTSKQSVRGERAERRGTSYLRLWLAIVAMLVLIMITIGGATRLTGSGLSITEWKPITGAIPPLDAETWTAEFERYQQIPQYKLQNAGISLAEFKTLFWWEWSHRQLGRIIGLVYVAGYLGALALGYARGRRLVVLTGLGLLLGLQGLVGWLMVKSGLEEGMVAVAPVRLALHLTLASTFFASIVWMLSGLRNDGAGLPPKAPSRARAAASVLVLLVFVQIALGGLVAGNKAGMVYNTWPMIDGAIVPAGSALFFEIPWWRNLLDNHLTVQFLHRMSAYLLLIVAVWHVFDLRRTLPKSPFSRSSHMLAGLVFLQAMLGIVTLLLAVPLWAGLSHQALAMLVLAAAVNNVRVSVG